MRILLTGASGQLGSYLRTRLANPGWKTLALGGPASLELPKLDLASQDSIRFQLDSFEPDVILHAAAISSAEQVRIDPIQARLVNVEATRFLADWAERRGRRLVFTSTDLVFDGSRPWNREIDPANPVLAYGQTKRDAEDAVLAISNGLVARLSLLYGPSRCGRPSAFDRSLATLFRGEPQTAFEDEFRTPLDLATAADILVRLLEGSTTGLIHVAGGERVSRFELLRGVAIAVGQDPNLILANHQADARFPEPRPVDVSLDTSRLSGLFPEIRRPTIEAAVIAFTNLGLST